MQTHLVPMALVVVRIIFVDTRKTSVETFASIIVMPRLDVDLMANKIRKSVRSMFVALSLASVDPRQSSASGKMQLIRFIQPAAPDTVAAAMLSDQVVEVSA